MLEFVSMFKHSTPPLSSLLPENKITGPTSPAPLTMPVKPSSENPAQLRELIEKNLKWSQIIYEQNRKINNKLLWSAVANWLRLLVLIVPFILAAWYLPAALRNLERRYNQLTNGGAASSTMSAEDIIKFLPLSDTQREELKAILKK